MSLSVAGRWLCVAVSAGLCGVIQLGCRSTETVAPLPPPQAEVRLGSPINEKTQAQKPAEWRDTILTLARDMVAIYETKVAPEPPTGRKPFYIVQSTDGVPRANYGGDRYNVIVVMLSPGGWHTQATFQLGHELGHFWCGPNAGWYVESFCTALGFMCMNELHQQWTYHPKSAKWAARAADMKKYHDERNIQRYLRDAGLKDMEAAREWARTKVPGLMRDGGFDRTKEGVLAAVIEEVLYRHPGTWGAIPRLADVQTGPPLDFQKWYSIVTPEQRPLVKDLAAAMGTPIKE